MKNFLILLLLICLMTTCDRQTKSSEDDSLLTGPSEAQVIGFETEKCYCCWGWVIKVGNDTIKAESIPNLSPSDGIVFPINATISIGRKTIDCSKYNYYEIIKFAKK